MLRPSPASAVRSGKTRDDEPPRPRVQATDVSTVSTSVESQPPKPGGPLREPLPPNSLRRYQLAPFDAILRAAAAQNADQLVIVFPRQAGKNELSAHVEAVLMAQGTGKRGVKAAPTFDPQATRSLKRLSGHLRACGFKSPDLQTGTDTVTLGTASWWFGSGEPNANVVGDTASLLLEFDEAQDFDVDVHDRRFSPMAATTAAARVYYGTPFTDFDLLAQAEEQAAAATNRDGTQRVFRIEWERVAEELPAYGTFVDSEMRRLGHTPTTPHPAILTEYLLQRRPGMGRFLTPEQLALLQGDHPRLTAPQSESHNVYVAAVDFAGADISGSGDPDLTVVTIARARFPGRGRKDEPITEIVTQYEWRGTNHDVLRVEVLDLIRRWRASFVVCDATGIGEPHSQFLQNQLGEDRVELFKFTTATKSTLAFDALAAINTGRLKVYAPDGEPDTVDLMRQMRLARSEAKPGGRANVYVHENDGHDDRLISALLAQRAAQRGRPSTARMGTFQR